jgi:hypothetical protein
MWVVDCLFLALAHLNILCVSKETYYVKKWSMLSAFVC